MSMYLAPNEGIKIFQVNPEDGSMANNHGGDHTWSQPFLGPDGVYVPGAWTTPVYPSVCVQGYHLTTPPPKGIHRWFTGLNSRAYLAEYEDAVDVR